MGITGVREHRNLKAPQFGQEKTKKHKHFWRDGARDKHEPSPGQTGPLPGTNWDPSLGQTGLFLFDSTVKPPFCPVCPWDGWGFVPGTIVPQGRSEKCLCVFCLLVFFAPQQSGDYAAQLQMWIWRSHCVLLQQQRWEQCTPINILKTTPTPNKNGSYGVKVGVRMP